MKIEMPKGLAGNKRVRSVIAFVQRNKPASIFIAAFAGVGIAMLISTLAATGNDLVVTNISMSPANPVAGQAVTFTATVQNQGTTPVPSGTAVGVAFEVDGQKVSWNRSNTSGLAAGATVTLTANAGSPGTTWTATSGPHTLRAIADDLNVIPDESDEGNNTRTTSLTIGNTGSLSLSPASTTVLINNNFTVDVRLTPGTTVDGVEATLTYDPAKLQFVSTSATGSPFDIELTSGTTSNTVTLARGNLSGGVSTDALVAKVTFKALVGTGTGTVQLAGNATKSGAYTNPVATGASVTFQAPDTTAPAASITAPANAAVISGTQTITATATDAVGVTKVELYIDGQLKGTDTTSPYSFSYDTNTLTNASHTIQVKAYDAANNVGTSASRTVTVKNLAEDINLDGTVSLLDFSLLAAKFGQTGTGLGRADINGDAKVNLLDFSLLAAKFGQ